MDPSASGNSCYDNALSSRERRRLAGQPVGSRRSRSRHGQPKWTPRRKPFAIEQPTGMNNLNTQFHKPSLDPRQLRKTVLDMAYAGSTVHIACAFSIIDLLVVLYRTYLRYPGKHHEATLRDYLVLSKGHGVMAQYPCLRELGWLKEEAFTRYFADCTDLKGLTDSRIPVLEVASSSVGHGYTVGIGLALYAKLI